jgi:hypothetical protein
MFMYKIIDHLPKLPDEFVPLLTSSVNNPVLKYFPPRPYVRGSSDSVFDSADQTHYQVTHNDIIEWVNHNVTKNYFEMGFRFVNGGPSKSVITPHTDSERNYALIYSLETGGGDLTFWQQHNCPVLRQERFKLYSYHNLAQIEKIHIPEKCWYILNSMVIHSVENLSSQRTQLQLSLKEPL